MNIAILTGVVHVEDTVHHIMGEATKRGHTIKHFYIDEFVLHLCHDNSYTLSYHNLPLTDEFDFVIPYIDVPDTEHGLTVLTQFVLNGVATLNRAESILKSRNKVLAHQMFNKHKIPSPATVFVARNNRIPTEMIRSVGGLPCLLKLSYSTCGDGVLLLKDETQAKTLIPLLQHHKVEFFLQRYVAESAGVDIRCVVLGGKFIAGMKRESKTGDFRSNISQGGTPSRIELPPEVVKLAEEAASVLGLGLAGVDIILTHDGPQVIEVNSAPGLMENAQVSGVDIFSHILNYLEAQINE